MSIWYTAGQERFRAITAPYYGGAQGVILVYDVENGESFKALPRRLGELGNYEPPEVVKIVVGNKLDKEYSRHVSTSEGAAFAVRTGCLFVEASAKTDVGVTEAFNDVVERIIDTPLLRNGDNPVSSGTTAAANTTAAESMPRNIDPSQVQDEDASAGCLCWQCGGSFFSLQRQTLDHVTSDLHVLIMTAFFQLDEPYS